MVFVNNPLTKNCTTQKLTLKIGSCNDANLEFHLFSSWTKCFFSENKESHALAICETNCQ